MTSPAMYTSQAHLDGTVAGMIVTVIVAVLGLVILIGVIFWAANHPDVKPPQGPQPVQRGYGTADSADPYSIALSSPGPVNPSSV